MFERDERNEILNENAQERTPLTPREIEELIIARDYRRVTAAVLDMHSVDIAEIVCALDRKEGLVLFRLLPKEVAAEVFSYMDSDVQKNIIASFTDSELASMLEELFVDDTVDLIEEMPAGVVKRIIKNSTHETRSAINRILRYPKDSAGSIMTTEYVRFKRDMTVMDALRHIRSVAIDKETIYTCYVTDDNRRLLGIVSAKDLLISPTETTLMDIMEDSVVYVKTADDKESVARLFEKYGFLALPVVDEEKRLVGIVTVDDAIDVIKEETEEDFAVMAAITPTEAPYLKTSAFKIFKSRIPWLLLLMVSATFSSMILNKFEAYLAAVFVLFVPMLMDTGGNSGSQASVTLIRGLSLGEVRFKDMIRVIWKEVRVGSLCAAILGVVAFGKIMLVDNLIMNNSEVTLGVALIVSVTLAMTVIISKLIGATLPMIAASIKLDPAVMASPFITTIVDALALIVYFFMAQGFLPLISR